MNTFKRLKFLVAIIALTACINSNAFDILQLFKEGKYDVDFTPVQIGIVGNLFNTENVYGFSFALPMSFNKNNYGIATGIWGKSRVHNGIQINMINWAHELNGLQIGFIGVIEEIQGKSSVASGVQWNLIANVSDTLIGFQSGLVNQSKRLNGTQLGVVNISDQGLQFGIVNVINPPRLGKGRDQYKSDAYIQVGIYNHSNNAGFQFGVLNYCKNSLIPYFPIFNFSID